MIAPSIHLIDCSLIEEIIKWRKEKEKDNNQWMNLKTRNKNELETNTSFNS